MKERRPLPTSRVPGVYAFPSKQPGEVKWQSRVKQGDNAVHLGTFESEALAAQAVQAREVEEEKPKPSRAKVPQSRFKGVYFVLGGRWEAKITYKSKSKHIGTYDTEEEAARAFDAHARMLGVPERCNFNVMGEEVVTNGTEPFRGVRRSRSKWRAVISVDGQSVDLGMFDTKEEAAEVCRSAEAQNDARKRSAPPGAAPQPSKRPVQQVVWPRAPQLPPGQWYSRLNAMGEPEYLFTPNQPGEADAEYAVEEHDPSEPSGFAPPPQFALPAGPYNPQASWGMPPGGTQQQQQPAFDLQRLRHHHHAI